jgi:hypothetical protein
MDRNQFHHLHIEILSQTLFRNTLDPYRSLYVYCNLISRHYFNIVINYSKEEKQFMSYAYMACQASRMLIM